MTFCSNLTWQHVIIQTLCYLREKNINFVANKENPPNLPQVRGIEMFGPYVSKI